jgi:Spy/CpxP family protein refolding chaperone
MRSMAAVLFAVAVFAAQSVLAEGNAADVTDMQALRTAVRADKKAFVASTLKLTDVEAKKFWPVYDSYQRDVDMANRRRAEAVETLINRDQAVSDLLAKNLANELIIADEIELKARRTLHNRLIKPLPGRTIMPAAKGARYLQLESKIRAYQAYDLATAIPLVK